MIHPYSHYPARAARRWPDRVALLDGERRRTYRELDERATRLGRALVGLGLAPGERVAVVQENRIEYVETVIAIARAGSIRGLSAMMARCTLEDKRVKSQRFFSVPI